MLEKCIFTMGKISWDEASDFFRCLGTTEARLSHPVKQEGGSTQS